MSAIRGSATALLSAGALIALGAFCAPAAMAPGTPPAAPAPQAAPATSFAFALIPSTVAPGGQVTLSVSDCDAAYATASSGVFDTVSIPRGQTVRVTVDRDARRGALYSVTFTCNGENGSADLTITGATSTPSTSSTTGVRRTPSAEPTLGVRPRATATATAPTATATATRAATPPPKAVPTAVRTAPAARITPTARASAPVSAQRSTPAALGVRGGLGGSVAGMDPVELGAGAALFAAAAGGTAYAVRRRRPARGH
ncbi:hypothetical protein [Streptomyces sp. W1SF4]|uniref:hypothetical protein n=1 Tax=Streptomyces sp. W1SF4 TaxID=2305220 RepID=UPI000F71A8E8|nr:hypothetical protein [Streptomyces sp. W1SF4]AZM92287.1 hypothetical protein D1J60_30630 [Streptomyces sp. W1SF4]